MELFREVINHSMLLKSKFINTISEQNTIFLNVTAGFTDRETDRRGVLFNDVLNY